MSTRYYVHGDLLDDDPEFAYCAKCGSFEPIAHFSFSGPSDYDCYRQMCDAFYGKRRGKRVQQLTRPEDAVNLFAAEPVLATAGARQAMAKSRS